MNKKFSTLVATLLLSGALVSVNATDVKTLADFKVNESTYIVTSVDDKTIVFQEDITLDGNTPYLVIDQKDLVIDGNGKTFTGRLVITADGVTVKNLKIVNKTTSNTSSYDKNAITVVAASVTILNNEIICEGGEGLLANGISIFPTKADATFSVKGNFIKNAASENAQWKSSAIIVAEGAASPAGTAAVLKDFDVASISDNTYENCAIDYLYKNYTAGVENPYKAAQVTPIVEADGSITNADYVEAIVSSSDNGKGMFFNGTAEQLAKALENEAGLVNVAIDTKDGLVTAGVKLLDAKIGEFELVTNISDKDSYETSDYYLLVVKGTDGVSYLVTADADGVPTLKQWSQLAEGDTENGKNLWKMEQALDLDNDYTFVFTNQAGKKLTEADVKGLS